MATGYSRTVPFTVVCGVPAAIALPAPPRGVLDRVILTQLDSHAEAATCNIYDRKGACKAAIDLHVTQSGEVVSVVAAGGGDVQITTASPHYLKVGDQIELKNCVELSYNVLQTVTTVLSDTEVVTNVAYVSDEFSGVLWQTKPFLPTYAPVTHLVHTFNKIAGTDYIALDLDYAYENQDNQIEVTRLRTSALYLEVLTVGTAEPLEFQVAYTCRADGTY